MNKNNLQKGKLLVCKSSAGSGKTFTLVKHYLTIALSDKSNTPFLFKKILAITFTNKAAAEMKERILKTLNELSIDPKSTGNKSISSGTETMKIILLRELGISEEELRIRSSRVLSEILHHYADFSVSTIDSFVHRIIRTFSFDLGLPLNFAIETDEKEIISQAVDIVLSKVGNDETITELLKEYTFSKIQENKNWQVDVEIKSFLNGILNEVNRSKLTSIQKKSIADFKKTRNKISNEKRKFTDQLQSISTAAFQLLHQHNLEVKDIFLGAAGIMSFFSKLKNKNFRDKKLTHNAPFYNSNIKKTLERELPWTSDLKNVSKTESIRQIQPELQRLYFEAEKIIDKNLATYHVLSAVEKEIFALSLLNETEKEIKQIKDEKNILFLSEFNQRISRLILEEPALFIYERMGEKYHYFLLDEFQDTSVNQWLNLLPLLINSIAENHENLIVGDAKQSIYRWRGGETSQFSELPKLNSLPEFDYKREWESKLIQNYVSETLDTNYRSYDEIIQFNNVFFEHLSVHILKQRNSQIYLEHAQKSLPSKKGGWITIDQIPYQKNETNRIAFRKIIEYIHKSVRLGYSYKDMCIIVRKNETGQQCANELTSNGIPVISSESLWLNNSDECNFIIQFLQILTKSDDEIACASLLHYLIENDFLSTDNTHFYLSSIHQNRKNLPDYLNSIFFQEKIDIDLSDLKAMPILDVCTFIVKVFGLESKNPLYIPFFLDACFEYSLKNGNSILDFIEWWNEKGFKKSVISPAGSDAVKILSIHASKGLEFPIVILPGFDWKLKNEDLLFVETTDTVLEHELPVSLVKNSALLNDTILQKEVEKDANLQELDNLNLVYVAFTRAIYHLHIISCERGNYDKSVKDWIDDFVEKSQLEKNNDGIISIGNPLVRTLEKKEANQITHSHFKFRNWHDTLTIKQHISNSTEWEKSNREFGELIHLLLSMIKHEGMEHLAIENALKSGLLVEKEKDIYLRILKKVIYRDGIQNYYAPNLLSFNEKTILAKNGNQYRIDRIVFLKNEIVLIDFKTGKGKAEDREQLNTYRNLISEIDTRKIKNILYYMKEDILHEF